MSLRLLVEVVRRNRKLCAALTLAGALITGVTVLLLPDRYEATVLLEAANTQSVSGGTGSIGSAVSQLGGIASLFGLNMTGDPAAKAEAVATLESEVLTERYIRENSLLPLLFSDEWDMQLKKWKTTDPKDVPTLWRGNKYFAEKVREVSQDQKSGLITLTITWTDAQLAADWANDLVKLTNTYLRDKAIAVSERNIAYLGKQAENTKLVGLRDMIYSVMEGEIKKEMLAQGNEEYALKIIDPAVPAEKPSSPLRILWTLAGLLAGAVIAVAVALGRYNLGWSPRQ